MQKKLFELIILFVIIAAAKSPVGRSVNARSLVEWSGVGSRKV
jgi:hypothetical protein